MHFVGAGPAHRGNGWRVDASQGGMISGRGVHRAGAVQVWRIVRGPGPGTPELTWPARPLIGPAGSHM